MGGPVRRNRLDSGSASHYRRDVILTRVRARASLVAPALLLSLIALACPHIGDSHHDPDGDFALVVAHDASGHGLGTPSSDQEPPRHCAICHWSRSFRPLTQIAFLGFSSVDAVRLVGVDVFTAARSCLAAQPPLRAPPTSPTRA
jgi:hypothetical protein